MGQDEGSANTALLWLVPDVQNLKEKKRQTTSSHSCISPGISPGAEVAWDEWAGAAGRLIIGSMGKVLNSDLPSYRWAQAEQMKLDGKKTFGCIEETCELTMPLRTW